MYGAVDEERSESLGSARDAEMSTDRASKRRRVTVEEIEDIEGGHGPWVCTDYPGLVAKSLGAAVTHFENYCKEQEALGESAYGPFTDEEEWGLVKWMMKRTTQTGIDEFCKLPIVRLSFEVYLETTDV